MSKKDYILGGLEIVLWYTFIYLLIYSIKHEVNLFIMSFVLLAIMYAATISCPIVRHTTAWMRLFGKKE